ncbi:MAG: RidA family protein [bacterium]
MKIEILTENAPQPIGPYSQAILAGDFLFVSGQIAIDPLTGQFEEGDVRNQTKRVLENLNNILREASLSFSDIVKITIYLKEIKDFPIVNEVYEIYVSKPFPARATVEVSNLPKGALIEIDAIAYKKTG